MVNFVRVQIQFLFSLEMIQQLSFSNKFYESLHFFKCPPEVQMFAAQQRLFMTVHQTYANFKDQIINVDEVFKVLAETFVLVRHFSEILSQFW